MAKTTTTFRTRSIHFMPRIEQAHVAEQRATTRFAPTYSTCTLPISCSITLYRWYLAVSCANGVLVSSIAVASLSVSMYSARTPHPHAPAPCARAQGCSRLAAWRRRRGSRHGRGRRVCSRRSARHDERATLICALAASTLRARPCTLASSWC